MFDEVQAGIGRTGEFLGFQNPESLQQWPWPRDWAEASIGAIWISEQYAEAFGPGSHGTTLEDLLACSAANAVLDVLERRILSMRLK